MSGRVPDMRRARRSTAVCVFLAGALSFVLFAAVNVVSYRLHGRPSLRLAGATLLDETQDALGRLPGGDEYRLVSFVPADDIRGDRLDALLEHYCTVSEEVGGPRVLRRRVDPDRDVRDTTVDELGLRGNTNLVVNSLVVARKSGDSFACRILPDAAGHFSAESAHTNGATQLERRVNAAMLGLAHGGRTPDVCFLTGHGELGFGEFAPTGGESLDLFARHLRDRGFRLRASPLADGDAPEAADAARDCDLLVIAGARTALTVPTEERLERYVSRGGKLLVLLNGAPPSGLADLLERWNVFVETSGGSLGDSTSLSQITLPPARAAHPILDDLGLRRLTFLRPLPLRVAASESAPRDADDPERRRQAAVALVEAPQRIASTNRLAYAVAAERPSARGGVESGPRSRIVVVGDVRFLENRMLAAGYASNLDFAMACVNWLVESDLPPEPDADAAAGAEKDGAKEPAPVPAPRVPADGWLARKAAELLPPGARMRAALAFPFVAPPAVFLLLGLLYVRHHRRPR